jgi:hypothetical protein
MANEVIPAPEKRPVVASRQGPFAQIQSVRCAWKGCSARCPTGELPPGWAGLLALWQVPPTAGDPSIRRYRDMVLCPPHLSRLAALLQLIPDYGQQP